MDQDRKPEGLQEQPTEQEKVDSDSQPNLAQSSTATDGEQQDSYSTSNTKPQATNKISDRSARETTSTCGPGES